jgi:hypothetical protein
MNPVNIKEYEALARGKTRVRKVLDLIRSEVVTPPPSSPPLPCRERGIGRNGYCDTVSR